jgi:type II secretory pathway component GspD/PulD (secretin)
MNVVRIVAAALAVGGMVPASTLAAQQQQRMVVPSQGEFVVKTVPLHHLTSTDAVKLLQPYTQSPSGGVFAAPANIRAVTIREIPRIFNEMLAVLREYDREPASVTLNFQLISAEHSTMRDAALAGLDSVLRGVLKFPGYRLLSTSVASAGENVRLSQTLSAEGQSLNLSVGVGDIRIEDTGATVELTVGLYRSVVSTNASRVASPELLSTQVTVPIGQTIVLGSSTTDNGQRALILTVRPQIVRR